MHNTTLSQIAPRLYTSIMQVDDTSARITIFLDPQLQTTAVLRRPAGMTEKQWWASVQVDAGRVLRPVAIGIDTAKTPRNPMALQVFNVTVADAFTMEVEDPW